MYESQELNTDFLSPFGEGLVIGSIGKSHLNRNIDRRNMADRKDLSYHPKKGDTEAADRDQALVKPDFVKDGMNCVSSVK